MNENGAVLVIALTFVALLTMLGATAVIMTTTDMKIGANYKDSELAFNNAQAGVQYAIGKMEEGLKAWPRTFTLPVTSTGTVAVPLISTFAAPTGFNFTYPGEITRIPTDSPPTDNPPDIYEFTSTGTTTQGSSASITVRIERVPAIMFGAFGDVKVDLKNDSDIVAYSHTDNPNPDLLAYPVGFDVGEADAGSNVAVNLDTNSEVDGDIGLGADALGTDAGDVTGQGSFTGTDQDLDRVDPDPLGLLGGEYADFLYVNPNYSVNNDNLTHAVFDPVKTVTLSNASLIIGPGATLTLKGQPGGSNFYWHDITMKSNSFLYIDTTPQWDGTGWVQCPVNIWLTGAFSMVSSQMINTTDPSCTNADGLDGCDCCDTAVPPAAYTCTRGAPSNFSLFASSTSVTDEIVIGNSAEFSGLIYAPGIEIEMKNSAAIYGALMGKTVEINNGATLFFDVDMKDKFTSNDMKVISWRDDRM